MIESIYLTFFAFGAIFLVLGKELETITYNAISILFWLMVMASNLFIEIPSVDTSYEEPALMIISFAMILINALIIISQYGETVSEARTNRIVHKYR